ncbi:unnamed protein product [Euphydryas editha]|uniref:Uncharacterized protein n=1 Tax=Euphydryas editha TaxID=104508 RepID=A0AAU9U2B8_EUPED|nr:unnamed protein product [Euphydryas editha]
MRGNVGPNAAARRQRRTLDRRPRVIATRGEAISKRSPCCATHHPLMSSPSKQSLFSHRFHKHTVIRYPRGMLRCDVARAPWRRSTISFSLPPRPSAPPLARRSAA